MGKTGLTILAVAVALGATAAGARSGVRVSPPYAPALKVISGPGVAAGQTFFRVARAFGAPATADAAVWVPAGYRPTLGQAVGTQVGTVQGDLYDHVTPSYAGTVTAADPATPDGECDTAGRSAAWIVTMKNTVSTFSFVVAVRAAAGQPTQLHWCFPKDAPRFDNLSFRLDGVFTTPARGEHLWDGRFTPYDPVTGAVNEGAQVSALALVRLPQLVRLKATYSASTRGYVLAGRATEDGKPVVHGPVIVSESIAGSPFRAGNRIATYTSRNGTFTVAGRLDTRKPVRFRVNVTAGSRDLSKPSCGLDVNGTPCVHEFFAEWAKDSNVVAIRP